MSGFYRYVAGFLQGLGVAAAIYGVTQESVPFIIACAVLLIAGLVFDETANARTSQPPEQP